MEDLNNFVDETGKKLGLSEDGIAKAKEELIAAINKRDEQYRTRMERSTRKIRHDMAIEQLKRQFACSHRKGTLALMPEYRTPGDTNRRKTTIISSCLNFPLSNSTSRFSSTPCPMDKNLLSVCSVVVNG